MKSMKRALSLGLALIVMAAATSVAYARYAYIRQFTFDGDIGSTSVYGEAYVSLDGQDSSMTTITLQRSSDGGRTYKTDRVLTARHTTSSSYSAVGEADNLNPAYEYRLKAEVFVYDEDNNEIDYDVAYID